MDKIFLIDTNTITYNQLIDYVNGNESESYTDMELFFLNTIRGLVIGKIKDIDDLIKNMYETNQSIQLHTSGTTAEPKIVYQSFKNMVRNIKVSDDRIDDIWGLFYHPNRMAGYQVLFQSLLNKNTLVNMFRYEYKDIQSRMNKFGVTHISATPTLYKMIVSNDIIFEHTRQITLGGEGSNEKFQTTLKKYFPNAKVKNIYASTEVGSLFASDGELFKLPTNSKLVKIEDGKLFVHKDIVGESESIQFDGDWFNTGDLIEVVNETHFKILGRDSNVVKIAGYNVNLESVELKIQKLPFIQVCRVYSEENSVLGNILCCEIVQNGEVNIRELKSEMRGMLEKYEIPSKIRFVKSIEINENGKIKR
jgi:acyl-coenzyme A synthetase/AMP-(fatty) acid ligase